MSRATAFITNANTDGGLAASKSFVACGYRVVATATARLPFGLKSRYSSANHILLETIQAEYEAGLLDLLKRERPDVFLPLSSRAVFVASKYREELRSSTAMNVPSLDAFLAAYNKDVCAAECRQLGIPCPTQYSVEEAIALLETDREAVLVVKPDRDVGAAVGVRYVRTRQQLAEAMLECTAHFRGAVLQEYVPGGVEATRMVAVVFSRESEFMAAYTTQKVRQSPATGGLTAVSRTTADEHLVRQILPFFKKWKWCGPAEVELKFDSRTGEDKVIEINPRFPGYLRFLLECGLDLPAVTSGAAVPVPFPSYPVGVEYRNPGLVLASVLSGQGDIRSGVRDILKSMPAVCRRLNDPLPWLGKALTRPKADRALSQFLVERQCQPVDTWKGAIPYSRFSP